MLSTAGQSFTLQHTDAPLTGTFPQWGTESGAEQQMGDVFSGVLTQIFFSLMKSHDLTGTNAISGPIWVAVSVEQVADPAAVGQLWWDLQAQSHYK